MKGGEISGNAGSGVFVYCPFDDSSQYGTFIMEGGTIYGSASSSPTPPAGKENTDTNGAALFKVDYGRAFWGEGVYYTKGAASEAGPTTNATTYIVGGAGTWGSTDKTLIARK